MSVIALLTDAKAADLLFPWSLAFARARSKSLIVVCWTHAAMTGAADDEPACLELISAAEGYFARVGVEPPEIHGISGPSYASAATRQIRDHVADLVVTVAQDASGLTGATYATNPLLKQSPANTVLLFGGSSRSINPERIFVGATDNSNDGVAVNLACRVAEAYNSRVTLARAELTAELEDVEVGRGELGQLVRDAGVACTDRLDLQVFEKGDYDAVTAAMDENDLVLIGANSRLTPVFVEGTERPTVAVVQRAPPLRLWRSGNRAAPWIPRLSPADYAELIQGLRRGSRLGADFITMLSLAAIVASIGLLQDSPAVVIGSMLLAPLMTPMVGCALGLAQANRHLGNMALLTVGVGLLCTLAISFLIGLVAPGLELTPQIYARGEPTVLDLVVALASAAAAAYALARPNLVGSVAGVAIATALVPPLCSVGISLAYGDVGNAEGAALLFTTNFLAIVLSAALTFRLLGITSKQAGASQKVWVYGLSATFAAAVILVCIPLQHALLDSLVDSKPQPRAFPLAKTVMDALEERIESRPGVSLMTAGRPSSHLASSDVILIVGASEEIDAAFADELVEIVRSRMKDDSLVVEVHCVAERWHKTTQ